MAIPGMSGAAPMDPNYSASGPNQSAEANMDPLFNPDPQSDLYRQINEDNYFRGEAAKKSAEEFIKNNADDFSYTSKWFEPNYITYTPPEGSKMTYGELRQALGIPPGVISKTNPPKQSLKDKILRRPVAKEDKVTDNNVINKSIKIPVDQIGYYEMRMTEYEAAEAVARRNNGDPYGGYDRNMNDSEVSDMAKKYIKKQN